MLRFSTIFILCFALLSSPALADAEKPAAPPPVKSNNAQINIFIPPEASQAENDYSDIFKNLTKEQQETIKHFEHEYAKTADIEIEIASAALKIKHCAAKDTAIAKNPGKYTSYFGVYRNQLQARQRDERLKILADQAKETAFIDQKMLDGHFAYTSNLVFQVSFQIVKMNYEKGEFEKTDCDALARQLEAAYAQGNPLAGSIEVAPDKLQEIQRLAKNGDAEGQFMLGMLQMTGNGVPKDQAAGLLLLKKSAENGHVRAQLTLGIGMMTDMLGIPADLQEARYWLEKAAAQGSVQAVTALQKLEKN